MAPTINAKAATIISDSAKSSIGATYPSPACRGTPLRAAG
jgi:hypothetical protein